MADASMEGLSAEDFNRGLRRCHLCERAVHWRSMQAEKRYKKEGTPEWEGIVSRWGTSKGKEDVRAGKQDWFVPHVLRGVHGQGVGMH